jgi:anaphase-promoting complex subunit 10
MATPQTTPAHPPASTPAQPITPHSPAPSGDSSLGSGSSLQSDIPPDDPPLSPSLREISTLASWTVSTFKPGCGVRELLSPSTASFWQSDGPQPHLLTIHFFKVVSVVRMRIYLDLDLDESYTPTRMVFAAGMGEHDLVEFAEWRGEDPHGWVEVPLDGCGGRASGRGYGGLGAEGFSDDSMDELDGPIYDEDDGCVLRCMCVQIRVLENHQNGKDTHVRGVQLYARDEKLRRQGRAASVARRVAGEETDSKAQAENTKINEGVASILDVDWLGEPEIR